VLLEEVKYYYGDDYWQDGRKSAPGSPTLIARKRTDENFYRGTLLTYNKQGELWIAAEHVWGVNEDGTPNCDANQRLRVREFGGTGRGRNMVRDRDPNDPSQILTNPLPLWSDYDGDTIYGDYTVTESAVWNEETQRYDYGSLLTEKTAYLPGIGQMDSQTGAVTYYHTDHLGTLRVTTDGTGALAAVMVYTAFGEVVATDGTIGGEGLSGTRYQYAGDSGYESGLLAGSSGVSGLSWQHVGYRWYDPSTGRFLQRDPIGIRGGINVYSYAGNAPTFLVDPQGKCLPLIFIGALILALDWAAQYADAPQPGGPIYRGGAGPSGASAIGAVCLGLGVAGQLAAAGVDEAENVWGWRGNGPPGSDRGNWINRDTNEKIHPHNNPSRHGPHDDYVVLIPKSW
jgi:RHS repeat-associated protein